METAARNPSRLPLFKGRRYVSPFEKGSCEEIPFSVVTPVKTGVQEVLK
jgi:hypothetical protein